MASLTQAEHEAISLSARLWSLIVNEIVSDGAGKAGDLEEIAAAIHVIQRAILANSAAREYPGLYRLLGGEFSD